MLSQASHGSARGALVQQPPLLPQSRLQKQLQRKASSASARSRSSSSSSSRNSGSTNIGQGRPISTSPIATNVQIAVSLNGSNNSSSNALPLHPPPSCGTLSRGSRSSTASSSLAGTKRKKPPGSRGVANLTAEQLEKKRANDRDAQRAIRERTKNQIECLEKRIRELENQRPYQELQAVVREKEAVVAENGESWARLRGVMEVLRGVLEGGGMCLYTCFDGHVTK